MGVVLDNMEAPGKDALGREIPTSKEDVDDGVCVLSLIRDLLGG